MVKYQGPEYDVEQIEKFMQEMHPWNLVRINREGGVYDLWASGWALPNWLLNNGNQIVHWDWNSGWPSSNNATKLLTGFSHATSYNNGYTGQILNQF